MSKKTSYTILLEPEDLEQMQKAKNEKGVSIQYQLRKAVQQYLKAK